jgi:hypothetical protein
METKHYTFISDPGHGWLKVPESDLQGTGLVFSGYSPRRGGFAYLEEDCDAPKYLDYLKGQGIEFRITEQYVERFDR